MISVLMPCRNAQSTVEIAIKSTLRAIGDMGELVVINDHSDDSTLEIVSRMSDPRLRVIDAGPQSRGLAKALNLGISQSKGEFLARMDADDFCLPWRFYRQLRVMEREKVDFVFSPAVLKFKSRLPIYVPQISKRLRTDDHESMTTFAEKLLANCFLIHPTMLARESSLRALRGYESLPAEDYRLWLRAMSDGFSFHRDFVWAISYSIDANSLSRRVAKNFVPCRDMEPYFTDLARKFNLQRENGERACDVSARLANRHRRGISGLFDHGFKR